MQMMKRLRTFSVIVLMAIGGVFTQAEVDKSTAVSDADGQIVWYNCNQFPIEGKGWKETESYYDRLPAKAKGVVPEAIWGLSHHSAGMAIRFKTESAVLKVRWTVINANLAMPHMPATGVSGVDLYFKDAKGKWRFRGNGRPTGPTNTVEWSVNPGMEYALYLPLYNGVKSLELGIHKEKGLTILPPLSEKPVVFFGTSINQGACVSRPGMAGTSIVSRALGVTVINLGFSGNGRMEQSMEAFLNELDPSVYVMDCMANMTPEQVTERTIPFLKAIREARP
ncbi:MAG: SGNH/GDSL hydrolase family protein, partial [Verrucomicrobiota bacterium]